MKVLFFNALLISLCLSVVRGQEPSIQDCLGAIPVCRQIYEEDLAPIGFGNVIDFNPDDVCLTTENNSIWYTFTVDNSGKFGFLLAPKNPDIDYDWALFDITNASCEDLYDNPDLAVSCNAAGSDGCNGLTGATGDTRYHQQGANCGNDPPDINLGFSPFNDLIDVEAGNTYALCITNFSGSLDGYVLDFGLSADIGIFDETPPAIQEAYYPRSCNGQELAVQFSEFIQCATLSAANLRISGAGGPYEVQSIASVNCRAGGAFSKEFFLNVDPPVQPGAGIRIDLVVDGTTEALDLCNNPAQPASLDRGGPTLTEFLDLGRDTTICSGDTLILSGNMPGSYLWSDGSFGATLAVSAPGLYALAITTPCGETSDTLEVFASELSLSAADLGADTVICPSGVLVLDATAPAASYIWQDGSSGPTLTVSRAGTYAVTVSNECGETSDEIRVDLAGPVQAQLQDAEICPGDTVRWDVSNAGAAYVWQDGSTEPVFVASAAGTYSVTITTPCEEAAFTATIGEKEGSFPIVDLGPDTTLCPGESLLLEAAVPNAVYLWQDGSAEPAFTVSRPGTYAVTVSNECGEASDEVVVDLAEAVQAQLRDAEICPGDTVVWDVSTAGGVYRWQDGSPEPVFVASAAGTYSVTITTPCEEVMLTAVVGEKEGAFPLVDLGPDTTLCPGESLLLKAAVPNAVYRWQDGSSDPDLAVSQSGTYAVTVSNECGEARDEIRVDATAAIQLSLPSDTLLCPGESFLLDASDENATYYSWPDRSTQATFLVKEPGTYEVVAGNACEEVKAVVEVESCDRCAVYIPNAISPNGDGANDDFRPFSNCPMDNFSLRIFNRWGSLVFESSLPEEGWNGALNHQKMGNGVYIYAIQFDVLENGTWKHKEFSGGLTLIK